MSEMATKEKDQRQQIIQTAERLLSKCADDPEPTIDQMLKAKG